MSTIEAELWRIFTFYALHADTSVPDVWKIVTFVRFAKDCQITSSKFMVSELELDIVRLARNKRKQNGGNNAKDFDGTHTILIQFPDFLRLLEIVAVRVYPAAVSGKHVVDPAVSLRRLLLENVLLLACRRSDYIESVYLSNKDTEADSVVQSTFAKPLMSIFKYYVSVADKRRSHELAAEAIKQGVTRSDSSNRQLTDTEQVISQRARDMLRSQKDLISFPEFTQFCHDFTLKSTSLLTAIEVGEIFLNVVPLHAETKLLRGMSFSAFCHSLVAMAMLAYRTHPISAKNKVKGLLHFMWKAVNQGDKKKNAVAARGNNGAVSHAGSLNQFGAGVFCDFFIRLWTLEGFPNYTEVSKDKPSTGSDVLKRILASALKDREEQEDVAEEKAGPAEAATVMPASKVPAGPVVLHGFLLAALFRTRPELSEMVYLELLGRKNSRDDV